MVNEFRKKAPVQANQTLLTRFQALESENTRLKNQSSPSTRTDPTPNHPRRAGTPKTRSAPRHTVEDPHDEADGAETAPFRSPFPLDENPFDSPDVENIQDPGPSAAEDTYEQYLPKPDSVRFLESCNIESTTLKGVNAWLATTALGKGKNKVIDTAAAEFVAACSKV